MNKRNLFGNTIVRNCVVGALVSLCIIGLPSCSDDYNDTEIKNEIQDIKDRVTTLEEWQKTVNTDISSVKELVEALQNKNFITDVTPVTENGVEVGYTITFQTGKIITIKHGQNGKTPVIGVAKDGEDNTYYWTIKLGDGAAEFMTDEHGNKLAVTGPKGEMGADAVAPRVRINAESNEWEISTDGGENWNTTGVKATGEKGEKGDAIFAENGIDITSDPNHVIFTLADGTTLTLPRALPLTVGFDSYDLFMLTLTGTDELDIILPTTLQETSYSALVAEMRSESGTGIDIRSRAAASSPWILTLTEPTFVDGVYQNNAKVKIKAKGVKNGEKAILKVTLITANGQEISSSRVIEYHKTAEVNITTGGLEAALNGVDPEDIETLKVEGTLTADDFRYIKNNLKNALKNIDLSNTNITEIPFKAFCDFQSLKEVVLPESLTTINYQAFYNCPIENIIIPNNVTSIDDDAFRVNDPALAKLERVIVGSGVTQLPSNCFFKQANLKSVSLPQGLKNINQNAFSGCTSLVSIELPNSLVSIGNYAFYNCGFTQITIPDKVTEIGVYAFDGCRNLTQVTLSQSLKKLKRGAFQSSNIATIDLPETLGTIETMAFNWNSATTIIFRAKAVPNMSILDNQFGSITDKDAIIVKVPAESVKKYKAKLGKYFNNIVAIE